MTDTNQYLVLIGLDKDKKPRAARFAHADEAAVRKLASITGYRIGTAKSDEAVELALKLVDGKIFQSGKGQVPLVKSATYAKLLEVLEVEAPAEKVAPKSSTPAPQSGASDPWEQVTAGSVVLYHDELKGKDRGWWEATVILVSENGKSLLVRWTHFPTLKPFTIKRRDVALMQTKA